MVLLFKNTNKMCWKLRNLDKLKSRKSIKLYKDAYAKVDERNRGDRNEMFEERDVRNKG